MKRTFFLGVILLLFTVMSAVAFGTPQRDANVCNSQIEVLDVAINSNTVIESSIQFQLENSIQFGNNINYATEKVSIIENDISLLKADSPLAKSYINNESHNIIMNERLRNKRFSNVINHLTRR